MSVLTVSGWIAVVALLTPQLPETQLRGLVVDRVSRQPIAEVRVEVRGDATESTVRETSTDLQGKFEIVPRLPDDGLIVSARKSGYLPVARELPPGRQQVGEVLEIGLLRVDGEAAYYRELGRLIAEAAGRSAQAVGREIDGLRALGLPEEKIRLSQDWIFENAPSEAIPADWAASAGYLEGEIHDDGDGSPLANVLIKVRHLGGGDLIDYRQSQRDNGRYEFTALPPDRRLMVSFEKPGYGPFPYEVKVDEIGLYYELDVQLARRRASRQYYRGYADRIVHRIDAGRMSLTAALVRLAQVGISERGLKILEKRLRVVDPNLKIPSVRSVSGGSESAAMDAQSACLAWYSHSQNAPAEAFGAPVEFKAVAGSTHRVVGTAQVYLPQDRGRPVTRQYECYVESSRGAWTVQSVELR